MFEFQTEYKAPKGLKGPAADLVEMAVEHWRAVQLSDRHREARKVRDQWFGGARALSSQYHPPLLGLTKEQQQTVDASRSHINLVAPALDRLVNSIHAGRIRRRCEDAEVQGWIGKPGYSEDMASFCEAAFAFGTAVCLPIIRDGRLRLWFPDPLRTVIIADAEDTEDIKAIVEFGAKGKMRVASADFEGWVGPDGDGLEDSERGFLPAVIARGRRERGTPYGRSLVVPAADGSIKITENETQLGLLRDKQTQALAILFGEVVDADDGESTQRLLQFANKSESGFEFKTPESRLEDVIRLTERWATDTAISMGLPLDTFLPEKVVGSDASATAARQRAFPLSQRMTRLVGQWSLVENRLITVIAALAEHDRSGKPIDLDEVESRVRPEVTIIPQVADSEAETLASTIQKTEKFFMPIEKAIDAYCDDLPQGEREALINAWRRKYWPEDSANDEPQE